MATRTIIAAIQTKYDTLTAANFPGAVRPTIYFDEIPQTKYGAAPVEQLPVPYVLLKDNGLIPTPPSGMENPWAIGLANTIWKGAVDIEIYYKSLGDANEAWWAILWNGSSPNLKAGIAFSTLELTAPLYSLPFNCIPGRMIGGYAGFHQDDQRVHVVRQSFDVKMYQATQGTNP